MPLQFDVPEQLLAEITTLEINSFAVDMDRYEIHIAYDKGVMSGDAFEAIQRDLLVTVPPSEFMAAIGTADGYANAMPVGQVSVYGALKLALYDKLKEMTGVAGTVS